MIVGWPPQVKLERTPGDKKALNSLFLFLGDKRLLRYGYGTRAGITDLNDLAVRVDAIRSVLFSTLAELRPDAPVAEWLRKLQDAGHELLDQTNGAVSGRDDAPSDPSDIAPAVDQLREAFRTVAGHVFALYKLPAAGNLADVIAKGIGSPPVANP